MLTTTRFLLAFILLTLSVSAPAAARAADAVISADANLRTSPSDTAPIITPLSKETRVLARDRHKEWVKVEVPAMAESGWVHNTLVRQGPDFQVTLAKEITVITPGPQKISKTALAKKKKSDRPMQIIGVLDIQQVIDQSLRGRRAREKFEEMRQAGQTGQIDRIEQEMISKVITEIQTIVEKYAMEKGFTHVLNKNSGSVFYNEASFDITGDIISEYDRQASRRQEAP